MPIRLYLKIFLLKATVLEADLQVNGMWRYIPGGPHWGDLVTVKDLILVPLPPMIGYISFNPNPAESVEFLPSVSLVVPMGTPVIFLAQKNDSL